MLLYPIVSSPGFPFVNMLISWYFPTAFGFSGVFSFIFFLYLFVWKGPNDQLLFFHWLCGVHRWVHWRHTLFFFLRFSFLEFPLNSFSIISIYLMTLPFGLASFLFLCTRTLNILIMAILYSLFDHSNICVIPESGSDACFASSHCFFLLLEFVLFVDSNTCCIG